MTANCRWNSVTVGYIQNQKVPGSKPIDVLGQALTSNLAMVNLWSSEKSRGNDENRVRDVAPRQWPSVGLKAI